MQTQEILRKLESMMPFLSSTEQKIGRYILDHPSEIVTMSTKELSAKSNVSEASLIRFTRKLGVDGYTEFKLLLSAELASEKSYPSPVDVSEEDSAIEIYKKLASFSIASIESTEKTLDAKSLDAAVNLIYEAKKNHRQIYLSGMGTSSVLAKEFQIKLMRLNITSTFYEDIHLRLEASSLMKQDDLLICFTALGKSIQNQQLIQLANEKKAKVILITQYGNTKLAENADVTLYTSIIENNFRLTSQTSITVQSIIIDTLFLALALKDFSKIQSEVNDTKKLFHKIGYYIH